MILKLIPLCNFLNLFIYFLENDIDFNFVFYIKNENFNDQLTIKDIEKNVVCDAVYGNINKYFLDRMGDKYIDIMMNQIKVPEGIKKELITNLHKFMMSLSQAFHSVSFLNLNYKILGSKRNCSIHSKRKSERHRAGYERQRLSFKT